MTEMESRTLGFEVGEERKRLREVDWGERKGISFFGDGVGCVFEIIREVSSRGNGKKRGRGVSSKKKTLLIKLLPFDWLISHKISTHRPTHAGKTTAKIKTSTQNEHPRIYMRYVGSLFAHNYLLTTLHRVKEPSLYQNPKQLLNYYNKRIQISISPKSPPSIGNPNTEAKYQSIISP
jgi:hypothetical protein